MKQNPIPFTALVFASFAAVAFADDHIVPKAAFADTSYETQRTPQYTIDGSGINEETGACGVAHQYNMWMGKNSGNAGGAKFAKWFVVDLGAVYSLDRMKIWNFNMNNGASYASRGVKQIDIYVSTTDSDFSGAPTFSDTTTWTLFKENHIVASASGSSSYTGDAPVSFNGTSARWIGFWIDTLQASDAEYGGLSEVRFWAAEGAATSGATLDSATVTPGGSVLLAGSVRLADGVSSVDVTVGAGLADGTQAGTSWANTYTVVGCPAGPFSYEIPATVLSDGIYYFALGVAGAWSGAIRIPVGAALTTEWTGNADGSSWNADGNWTYGVPTAQSTAVFGSRVNGDLAVSVDGADAVARKVLFSTPWNVTIPSLSALDFEIAANDATNTVTALKLLARDSAQTGVVAVAAASRLSFGSVTGDASLLKTGPGMLSIAAASGRTAGDTVVREGLFVYSNNRQLGAKLVVGGGENEAIARANNNWDDNFNPFAHGGCPTEVLANGVLDMETDGSQKNYHRENTGPILVHSGGQFAMGNRKYSFATAGTTNLFIEGGMTYGPNVSIALDCNTIAVSALAGRQVVLDMPINSQQQMAGWATFTVDDIPGVPVDLVVNGKLSFAWAARDGFQKRGAGVARFTNANTYGGGSSDAVGWTRVYEGTLLVDNETGSGTGNSRVSVSAGATLGGTGVIGGQTDTVPHWSNPNTEGSKYAKVVAAGSADALATIAPGTIDDETGNPVPGVLTVGSPAMPNPVTFDAHSALHIDAAKSGVSRLTVYGKVTVSDSDSVLDLAAVGGDLRAVRYGTYTILSATEGIEGTFATQRAPDGWLVAYESETVDGASVVTRITLTTPPVETVILLR